MLRSNQWAARLFKRLVRGQKSRRKTALEAVVIPQSLAFMHIIELTNLNIRDFDQ